MVEIAIKALLSQDTEVVDLVDDRVFPTEIPEDSRLPAVAYRRLAGERLRSHSGPVGLTDSRVQVAMAGKDYQTVKSLGAVIRRVLNGYQGEVEGVSIESCWAEDDIDSVSSSSGRRILRTDYMVLHKE